MKELEQPAIEWRIVWVVINVDAFKGGSLMRSVVVGEVGPQAFTPVFTSKEMALEYIKERIVMKQNSFEPYGFIGARTFLDYLKWDGPLYVGIDCIGDRGVFIRRDRLIAEISAQAGFP